MQLKVIDNEFSVCKVKDYSEINLNQEYVFTGSTDEEKSLVCPTTGGWKYWKLWAKGKFFAEQSGKAERKE